MKLLLVMPIYSHWGKGLVEVIWPSTRNMAEVIIRFHKEIFMSSIGLDKLVVRGKDKSDDMAKMEMF